MSRTHLMRDEVELSRSEAKPCPFCGAQPTIMPWHGGGPRKRRVNCGNEDCTISPAVAESTRKRALEIWNTRPTSKGSTA